MEYVWHSVAIIALVIALHYLLRVIFYEMAKRNLGFTLVTEGEFVPIVKGKKFNEFVYSLNGKHLDENYDVVDGDMPKEGFFRQVKRLGLRRGLLRFLFYRFYGVIWVGIVPFRVGLYRFRRVKYAQEDNVDSSMDTGEAYKMTERVEDVDSLFYQYPAYGLVIADAETGAGNLLGGTSTTPAPTAGGTTPVAGVIEKVPVKCAFVFSTRTTNPYKTLFESTGITTSGDWIIKVVSSLRARLKAWIGSLTYEDLVVAHQAVGGADVFADLLAQVNADIANVGQEVPSIQFLNVDLANEGLRTAAQKLFIAKQEHLASQEQAAAKIRLADATAAQNKARVAGALEALAAHFAGGKIPPEHMQEVIRFLGVSQASENLEHLQVLGDSTVLFQPKPTTLRRENQPAADEV